MSRASVKKHDVPSRPLNRKDRQGSKAVTAKKKGHGASDASEKIYEFIKNIKFSDWEAESDDSEDVETACSPVAADHVSRSDDVTEEEADEAEELPDELTSDQIEASAKSGPQSLEEAISSEENYMKQLESLMSNYRDCAAMQEPLADGQHYALFGNINDIYSTSLWVAARLKKLSTVAPVLRIKRLCQIWVNATKEQFGCYVTYLENHPEQLKTLATLREKNTDFEQALQAVESNAASDGATLECLLKLPVQRMDHYQAMLERISKVAQDDEERRRAKACVTMLKRVTIKGNAKEAESINFQKLMKIAKELDFGGPLAIPLVSKTRGVVDADTVKVVAIPNPNPASSQSVIQMEHGRLKLYLLNDVLIIAGEEQGAPFHKRRVLEMPSRWSVVMEEAPEEKLAASEVNTESPHLLSILLLGSDHRYIVSCETSERKDTWLSHFVSSFITEEKDTVYADYDQPRVQASFPYDTVEPGYLDLQTGDELIVNRRDENEWAHGERLSDGEMGWFPWTYVNEIEGEQKTARELRQNYHQDKNKT